LKQRRKMKPDRAEKKAALMREAERLIEELLEWEEENEAPNLGEIEEEILAIRQELGQEMLKGVLSDQASIQPVPGPSCPGCGQEMRYKGRKGKQVESLAGGLKVERGYYYCAGCAVGIFPPG
jgi:DNA repair exonuclease SbcCD ATPase subunit